MTNKTDNTNWKAAEDLEAPGLYVQRLDGKDEFIVTRLVAHIGSATRVGRKLYYANTMEEVHQLEQIHADYFGPIPE